MDLEELNLARKAAAAAAAAAAMNAAGQSVASGQCWPEIGHRTVHC